MRLFAETPFGLLSGFVFTSILVVAALGDLRSRRIPNRLVASLALLGLGYSISRRPDVWGALSGLEGLLTGLACWIPFYALGWLGAGDVKLFAAAGAWLGPMRAVEGALAGALVGAVLAAIWMLRSRGIRESVQTLGLAAGSPTLLSDSAKDGGAKSTLPYAIAIAFGAIWAAWMPGILSR